MDIIFYNPCRNGDIHISRNFVKKLCENIGIKKYKYIYSHKNGEEILKDISYIQYDSEIYKKIKSHDFITKIDNKIYINTWYGSNKSKYLKKYKITLDCLYFLFKDIFNHFSIKIENIFKNPLEMFPSINYNVFNIKNIKNIENSILFCNGQPLSNQSYNINLDSIVIELASLYKNKNFILTKKINFEKNKFSNIFFTSDIVNKLSGSDLNEISYLSLNCDMIIGRASGPFTFCMTQENLNNPNKKMITFSRLPMSDSNSFFLGEWGKKNIKYKAKIIQPEQNISRENAIKLIKNYI